MKKVTVFLAILAVLGFGATYFTQGNVEVAKLPVAPCINPPG